MDNQIFSVTHRVYTKAKDPKEAAEKAFFLIENLPWLQFDVLNTSTNENIEVCVTRKESDLSSFSVDPSPSPSLDENTPEIE